MPHVLSRRMAAVVATVLSAGTGSSFMAQAAPLSFKVPPSGGQEVPPVFPAGAGVARE